MTNSELARLIATSGLHEEDTREIVRIFPILTYERQVAILHDWDRIAWRIRASRERLEEEKTFFLKQALENIERDIATYEATLRNPHKNEHQL